MSTVREQLAQLVAGSQPLEALCSAYRERLSAVRLQDLVGGALSFYAAAAIARTGGVHLFVAEDRDAAAYLVNDFYDLLDEERVLFFPSAYKRSPAYGAEDAQGVVRRTAAMNALRSFAARSAGAARNAGAARPAPDSPAAQPPSGSKGEPAAASSAPAPDYLVVCTYPEALAERVADAEALGRDTLAVSVGDRISVEVLVGALADAGFERVDFVYEPGQYALRGLSLIHI